MASENGPLSGDERSIRHSGGGLLSDEDGVTKVVKPTDQALGDAALVAAVEIGLTEFGVGSARREHVIGSGEDLVADRESGALGAQPGPQAKVLVLEIAALGVRCGVSGLNEGGLQVDVALASGRAFGFAPGLVVSRADARPGSHVLGRG